MSKINFLSQKLFFSASVNLVSQCQPRQSVSILSVKRVFCQSFPVLQMNSFVSMFTSFFCSTIMILKILLIFYLKRFINLIDLLRHLMSQTLHINLIVHLTKLSEFMFHLDALIHTLIEKFFVHSFERIYLISSSKNKLI